MAEPDKTPLLELRDISLRFGGLQALAEVSLLVPAGKLTALIGPNGAGKTSLLNVVCGLYTPQAGQILLDGRSLEGLPVHRRSALGLSRTFQAVQLVQEMNTLDNLLLGLHCQGQTGLFGHMVRTPVSRREEAAMRQQGMDTLERFSLGEAWNRPVAELTLWQRKLLELARAVIKGPRLILLDEPMGGLTMAERESMAERLQTLRAQGMSMVMVDHDMDMVMSHADHVLVLHHGRLLAQGPPRVIQTDPEVVAAYLGE